MLAAMAFVEMAGPADLGRSFFNHFPGWRFKLGLFLKRLPLPRPGDPLAVNDHA